MSHTPTFMGKSAGEYVRYWRARRGAFGLVHPARHSDWRVRAVFWRQERAAETAIVTDCAQPSAEYDAAFDAMLTAHKRHDAIVQDAWDLRKLVREGERYSTAQQKVA